MVSSSIGRKRLAVLLTVVTLILPSAALGSEPATADVTPPQVIAKSQRPPDFPPAARAARFEGEVTVRVTVLPTGVPANISVVHSSHPKVGFEEAAIAAVKKWRFIPAMNRDVPVEYETQYRLTFGRRGVGVSRGGLAQATLTDSTAPVSKPPRRRSTNTLRRGR